MPYSVVIALGSNLGDRAWYLRRAMHELSRVIRIVRVSSIIETDPIDAPPPRFLNMVVAGYTRRSAEELLDALQEIEKRLGRRRSVRNAPRVIDLDLILHSAHVHRSRRLILPHPRYRQREFVMRPLRELGLANLLSAYRIRRPAPRAGGQYATVPPAPEGDRDSPSRRSD